MMKATFVITLLALCATASKGESEPECYDEQGNPVDWFMAYKFPSNRKLPTLASGMAYAYITSDSVNMIDDNEVRRSPRKSTPSRVWKTDQGDDTRWVISEKTIDDPESVVMRTVSILYEKRAHDVTSLLYNDGYYRDEEKGQQRWSGGRAHAKGVVIFDEISDKAIWMVHSAPQFPPTLEKKEPQFEENIKRNAQVFMCMSLRFGESAEALVDHLYKINAIVYDSKITPEVYAILPELNNLVPSSKDIMKRRRSVKDGAVFVNDIKTRAGESCKVFTKTSRFDGDIYADLMDSDLGTSLYVATWRSGQGSKMNSSCPNDNYHVNNVVTFQVPVDNTIATWSFGQDHGKWAISDTRDKGIVCIGDINRMESQTKRGGGSVCMKCPACWSAFSKTIADTEPCQVHIKHA